MALPRKYLAEKSSGSEFKLLSTADLTPTAAVVGPGSSTPGDFAIWGGFDGKTLIDGVVQTDPAGALDGNGTAADPLAVRVDGVTITINASNELEAAGGGSGTVTNTGTLTSGKAIVGNGGVDITVSALTADLVSSASGTPSGVAVRNGLTLAGGNLDVNVDNETIGLDSNDKLEVLQRYAVADGNLDIGTLVQGDGGTHVSKVTIGTGLSLSGGTLTNTGGTGGTVHVAAAGALTGDGSIGSPLAVHVDNESIGIDSQNKLEVIGHYIPSGAPRHALGYSGGYLDVQVDNETIGINTQNKLETLGGVGVELDYVEFQANVSPTATTEGTANTVVSGTAVHYNGATTILIEFFAVAGRPDATAIGRQLNIWLFEDGTSIGGLGIYIDPAASGDNKPMYLARRMRPSAGNHTYSIRASVNAGTALINAGVGGLATNLPGFIRITRIR